MNGKLLGAAVAAAAIITFAPAAEAATRPKFGDSVEYRQKKEHDRVQRRQVKQLGNRPLYQPIFGPLYQGHNSPVQRTKRAFD